MLLPVSVPGSTCPGYCGGNSFNSLVPGGCCCCLKLVIFKLTSRMDILDISCAVSLRVWMPQDLSDDLSTVMMAWRQVITRGNVECNMLLLSHNELRLCDVCKPTTRDWEPFYHSGSSFSHMINSPPWTKGPPFRRRYFQMHFRELKVLYFG